MKLLVISDLHICNGDSFGAFGWDDDEFIAVLDRIKRKLKIDRVILNGDIFELYKYRYDEIERTHERLIRYFNDTGCVYIRGNHDILCHYGMDSYMIENNTGKKIYIEHGHNADFINGTRTGRIIGYLFMKLLKLIVRFRAVFRIYINLLERDEELTRVRKYNSYKYLKYALDLLGRYDVVIFGHTHKLEAHKTYHLSNKKRYLNSGSCSFGRFQGIVLDTESLAYETIKLDKKDIHKIRRKRFQLSYSA